MTSLIKLYDIADMNNVAVECFQMNGDAAMCMMNGEKCFIGIDPKQLKNEHDEAIKLAHDLGHCLTGAFYNKYSPLDCVEQKEYRANKWATHQLIPFADLKDAFDNGFVEAWELSEYFEVPEDFVRRAIDIYINEGRLIHHE